MADIVRSAASARPVNDYLSINVVVDVDVQAGQGVYIKSNGHGALSNAGAAGTMKCRGIASIGVLAGQAVALITRGRFGGFSGMTPGADVFASNTAGALADAAGTVPQTVGYALSATDIYVEL